jgi:TPR repeat protein
LEALMNFKNTFTGISSIFALLTTSFFIAQPALAESPIMRDDWYLAQPGNKATLQLSGHRTEKAATAYIRKNKISGKVGYFSTRFNGKPWFAVTYGAYSSLADARKGLASLPESLLTHAPWPRKFSAIKPLIDTSVASGSTGTVVTASPTPATRPVPVKAPTSKDAVSQAQAAYDAGDYSKAHELWLAEAGKGNAEAQFNIAVMYSRGESMKRDNAKAIEWYTRSAEQGYAPAQFNLGAAYMDGEIVKSDEALAATWWLKAARQDFVQAQFNIGSLYCRGIGVAQDAEQCKYWYAKAAENGDEHAKKMLASIKANEAAAAKKPKQSPETKQKPVEKAEPKPEPVAKPAAASAVTKSPSQTSSLKGNEWFMSRNPGHMTIQLYGSWEQANVSQFVKTHNIADKSHVMTVSRMGRTWFAVAYGEFETLAAAKKVDSELSSQFGITNTWVRTFSSIQESISKTEQLKADAAAGKKQPDPVAESTAPSTISKADRDQLRQAQSLFVRGKYMEALKLWQPLAEKGIAEAQYSLGFLYHSGWGPERDLVQATRWYTLAGKQEENRAQFNLGVLYLEGDSEGMTVDYAAGVKWIKRSARNGNTRARELLAEAYERGLYDLPKSSKEADYWKSR